MDEIYFLYLEDVDLSWRAWLSGRSVLYEPRAAAMHFSGGPFYRTDLVSPEAYLSLRNFLVISRKFFGIEGEERAVRMLKCHPDQELATIALDEYRQRLKEQVRPLDPTPRHPLVKIVGLNQFHEWSRA